MTAVLITNMVPPYRVRVFERCAEILDGEFLVLSCAAVEKGREWQSQTGAFRQEVLMGMQLNFGSNRNIFINPGVWKHLRTVRPWAVCTSGFSPTMLLGFLYSRSARVPHLSFLDSWQGSERPGTNVVRRTLRREILRRTTVGVAASQRTVDLFAAYGLPSERVRLSPIVPSWPAPEHCPDFEDRPFDLLWCGSVNDDHKGVKVFVDTARLMVAQHSNLSVRMVGTGPLVNWSIEAMRAAKIRVQWDGFLSPDAVAEAYLSAKLFLAPSRYDAWGLVVNEAAQCGTPVFVSRYAGASEMIEDGRDGRVLDLQPALWAHAASESLNHREQWVAFSRNARKRAAEYTVEQAADGLAEAFQMARRIPT